MSPKLLMLLIIYLYVGLLCTHEAFGFRFTTTNADLDIRVDGACKADILLNCAHTSTVAQRDNRAESIQSRDSGTALRKLQDDLPVTSSHSAAWEKIAVTGRERSLLGFAFHRHEMHQFSKQQADLQAVLERYGLNPNLPAGAMAAASAPIARCLRHTIEASRLTIYPDASQVSEECKAEVRAFFIRRAEDVAMDLPLLAACATDLNNACKNVKDSRKALRCLKKHKFQLQPLCQAAVTGRQVESAEDLALDAELNGACSADREELCVDAGWGEGMAFSCLLQHLPPLLKPAVAADKGDVSPACATALLQRQIEDSEDIRLNYRLASSCAFDKQIFCRDVKPGEGQVVLCLEKHLRDPDMTAPCKAAVEDLHLQRASDVRLDYAFVSQCGKDVQSLCSDHARNVLTASASDLARGGGNEALECLRTKLELIRNPQCLRRMKDIMSLGYHDNRLDGVLMTTCSAAIQQHCRLPAQALECLQEAIDVDPASLDGPCQQLVLLRQQQAAVDITFSPRLVSGCKHEQRKFCGGPDLEGAAIIECLVDHRHHSDFGSMCRNALVRFVQQSVHDIRLVASLAQDCASDVNRLCPGLQPGQGRLMQCLREKRGEVESELCRRQLLRVLGFVVEDINLDYSLMQACNADVQQFCAGVDPGNGEVHDCLRRSFDHLSYDCRHAQDLLEQMEHEDVRLNPKVQKECSGAITSFCHDVAPGNANIISCLQHASMKSGFPHTCKAVMHKMMDRSMLKFSLNKKLKDACTEDVELLCPRHAKDMPLVHGDETILGCLAHNSTAVSAPCKSELLSLVKLHFRRYRIGMPLTSPCDGDVLSRCNIDQVAAPFLEQGYVLQCLTKHVQMLHKPCWQLISSMDDNHQMYHAQQIEATSLDPEALEKNLDKVVASVRRELEPKLISTVEIRVKEHAEGHHPVINEHLKTIYSILGMVAGTVIIMAGGVFIVFRKRQGLRLNTGSTVVVKDGKV